MKVGIMILLCFLYMILFDTANAQQPKEFTYKQTDTLKLKLFVYNPSGFIKTKKYPAIIFFFGGGWQTRAINQFRPFAQHYASKGMVAILADYRVEKVNGTTPFESLKDAKSAIRYLRKNAETLGIDPQKIIASGGSAGGHLATACYTNETLNEKSDDLTISPKPNALVLFNPVIDNSKKGYGYTRVREHYPEFSPLHNIHKGFPPVIFFLGTNDKLIPVSTARLFKRKVESAGSRCELFLYKGQGHGFFNQTIFHKDLLTKTDAFLQSLGYIVLKTN